MKQYIEHDLVMLPSKDKENIIWKTTNGQIIHTNVSGDYKEKYESQHLYITSNDEIKEGDWFILEGKDVFKSYNCNKTSIWFYREGKKGYEASIKYCKKIIATTDKSLINNGFRSDTKVLMLQIPQQFIEYFITEYNEGNIITKVLIEYEEYGLCIPCNKQGVRHCAHPEECGYAQTLKQFKVNPDNTINIKPVEVKMYSKEEVIELFKLLEREIKTPRSLYDNQGLTKWIEENL